MLKPDCPFQNKDGKIVFPYRALHDKVFIWPFPNPEKYVEDGVVEIRQPVLHVVIIWTLDRAVGAPERIAVVVVGVGFQPVVGGE